MTTEADLEDHTRGDSFRYELTFEDGNGNPIDISGWTISFTLKRDSNVSDANADVALDVTSHKDPSGGKSVVTMPPETTAQLNGTYRYDFQVVTDNDHVETILMGNVQFPDDITRRTV